MILLSVRRIAVPGALVQILAATAMGIATATSVGLEHWRRAGVWPLVVGRQHRGAAAHARGAGRARIDQWPHRRGLADCRGSGDGAGAGVAARIRGAAWR